MPVVAAVFHTSNVMRDYDAYILHLAHQTPFPRVPDPLSPISTPFDLQLLARIITDLPSGKSPGISGITYTIIW